MAWRYSKHYTREEARALLPSIRAWLDELTVARETLDALERQMRERLADGADLGGEIVNNWVGLVADSRDLIHEFFRREIEIKDLERGLVDFPAFVGGQEVFLCWERDEEDIQFWHHLDAGYSGREPLE